jgi:ankyrin repeat protein
MNAWALATLNGHYDCFKLIDQIIPTISGRKQFYESKDDFGRTFMHLAAICGNYECLHLFLKSDCNLNEIDESGNNPLHYACVGSHLRCVELLVRSGVEVNEVNKSMKHYTPLMDITILNKNNESILKMISSNLNPHGSTPLMLACAFDSDGCLVRELVFRSNARADLCDTYGYNVLHYAAFQGNINVFEILLDKCKHLDHQYNEKSISPIHILAYYGHREALEFLLKHLTDVNVQDKSGRTPIDYACFRGETSCVESLILHNANIDLFKDSLTGRTALHAAALNNNDECLKIISLIINSKATTTTLDSSVTYLNEAYDYDLLTSNNTNCFYNSKLANLTDDMERTPLMIAVEQGHFNTINFLVNQMGADIFACDKKKRTALHRAAALGYEECCVVMLKSNFDCLMQRDLNGLLPIHYAIIAGHANLLFVFFEYYEKYLNENETNDKLLDLNGFSLLHISCFNGHSTCTETICDLSENYSFLIEMLITNEIAKYSTPLHMAIFNNHEQCVEILLDKFKTNANNYKLLIELKDQYENRPLHVAAMNNQYYVASLLIEADCVLNERNKRGHTPFMLAAAFNSFNIMELLLKKVAIKNDLLESIDFKGNSVLHLALLNNHENCALFILDKIENEKLINLQNKQGQTALHLAAKKGFTTVVEILLSKGANIWLQNKQKQTPLICCAKNEQVGECLNLMISLLMSNKLQNEQTNSIIKNDKTNPITMMMLMINQTNNNNNNNNNENNNINIDNSIQKSSTKIINKNNLNSTLILNDNNTNTSSNGTRSTASSNEQIDTNLINNINNEMEEQEQEGELIEDYDDEDEDEEGEIVRVNNLDNIINYDKNDKLIELVQSKTLPLPLNNNKDDSSLFDSDFF